MACHFTCRRPACWFVRLLDQPSTQQRNQTSGAEATAACKPGCTHVRHGADNNGVLQHIQQAVRKPHHATCQEWGGAPWGQQMHTETTSCQPSYQHHLIQVPATYQCCPSASDGCCCPIYPPSRSGCFSSVIRQLKQTPLPQLLHYHPRCCCCRCYHCSCPAAALAVSTQVAAAPSASSPTFSTCRLPSSAGQTCAATPTPSVLLSHQCWRARSWRYHS